MRLPRFLASLFVLGLTVTTVAQSSDRLNGSESGGTIIGRVIARGKPLPGATITLWHQPLAEPSQNSLAATGATNDKGEYELRNVPPGNYFISAKAIGFITGKENQIFANLRYVNDQGHLTIENIPAGEYSIRTPSGSGIVHKGEVPPTPNVFGESKRFEVTDKDIVVEVPITRAATVSGFLVVEGPAPADVLVRVPRMVLHGMILMAPITQATIKPDGSFAFSGLKPGKLRFNFHSPLGERPLPLRFVGMERDGVRLAEDIELRSGDQIAGIRLILAYASSSVNGVVNLNGGPLPPGITGVASLLKKGKVLFGIRGDLSSRGEFLLQNVPAGEYTLAVSARDANNKYWRAEQPITIADDQVCEATVVLKP